jgi:hypothetical protein
MSAGERNLADAIATRTGTGSDDLEPLVLAGVTVAAERAAVLHWSRQSANRPPLVDVVRQAVDMALRGISG